ALEALRNVDGRAGRRGRQVDDQLPPALPGGKAIVAKDHGLQCVIPEHTDKGDIALAPEVGRAFRPGDTAVLDATIVLALEIPRGDLVPARGEVEGDRRPHDAKTNNANRGFVAHERPSRSMR